MSNPTSNYSFQMPISTDLVTDLPADFEVFGQAVDTQMKTNADAATQKATLTTTGDIYYASSASTPARLGIGSTGQVLTVAGGVPTWATSASGGMTLLGTTTLTGNSVTISSISGSYNSLKLFIAGVTTSAVARVQIAPNALTTSTNTTYNAFTGSPVSTGILDDRLAFPQDTSTTSSQFNMTLDIDNYANTTSWKTFRYSGSTSLNNAMTGGGIIKTNSAITSLVVSLQTGAHTFTAGTVLLYGVK